MHIHVHMHMHMHAARPQADALDAALQSLLGPSIVGLGAGMFVGAFVLVVRYGRSVARLARERQAESRCILDDLRSAKPPETALAEAALAEAGEAPRRQRVWL